MRPRRIFSRVSSFLRAQQNFILILLIGTIFFSISTFLKNQNISRQDETFLRTPKAEIRPTVNIRADVVTRIEKSVRHKFVDNVELLVDDSFLDKPFAGRGKVEAEFESATSHFLSRIVSIKGDPSTIVHNRLPHCFEFTMNELVSQVSSINPFRHVQSQLYTPFSYDLPSSLSIGRSLMAGKHERLFYDRHLYFVDFLQLNFSKHPVWINLVRDPIDRIAIEFQRSRDFCRQSSSCFVRKDLINRTLDECVLKESPRECISAANGVSRMLPFFCGSLLHGKCDEANDWALSKAKSNIERFYTVVGYAEDFYKFLYVLEKVLPRYFRHSRLFYMNSWDPKVLAHARDIDFKKPTQRTVEILRPILHFEYQLYDFIKQRFLDQFNVLVDMEN